MQWIREKFGTVMITLVIGLITLVFIFYGFFSPKSTRGLGEGAVAGTVNGDVISITDFNRELNRRLEFFKSMMGGQVSEEQMKQFRIRTMVFQEMVRKKLMLQEAQRQGTLASDEEVREKVREIPAFQKGGQFDLPTYRQVLEANSYSPEGFERLIREDISSQSWNDYFRNRTHVSDEELKKEFMLSQDKRNIKYVLLTAESARKGVTVPATEVQKFLADPAKLQIVKNQFEQKKNADLKGKTFDAVKEQLAHDVLAGEKAEEARKLNEHLADQVLGMLGTEKSADAKVNALLKIYGVEVKTTGMVARSSAFVPGIGEEPELLQDAFAKKAPIDAKQGGKARKYSTGGRVLVALVWEQQKPNLSQIEGERAKLTEAIIQRKERALYDDWMKKLVERAKIDPNPSVVGDQS